MDKYASKADSGEKAVFINLDSEVKNNLSPLWQNDVRAFHVASQGFELCSGFVKIFS